MTRNIGTWGLEHGDFMRIFLEYGQIRCHGKLENCDLIRLNMIYKPRTPIGYDHGRMASGLPCASG
jgi:hypothetical protein